MKKTNTEKTASLVRFIFTSPKPIFSLVFILIISLIFGVSVSHTYSSIYYGFLFFFLPSMISVFITMIISKMLKTRLYLRREMLLTAISVLFVGISTLVLSIFITGEKGLLFGYASIIWLRYLVHISITTSKMNKAILHASTQSILGFLFIFPLVDTNYILYSILTFVMFLISVILFTHILKIPYNKSIGEIKYDMYEMVRLFLDHITECSMDMEKFFDKIGIKKNVKVDVISFKRKKNNKIKCAIAIPQIHPGPFGRLCGSDLPTKIKPIFDYPVLLFHSATTHTSNPTTTEYSKIVGDKIKSCVENADYSTEITELTNTDENNMNIYTQCIDNVMLVIHSPKISVDDVDEEIYTELYKIDKNIVFVDAHNCIEKGAETISIHTDYGKKLIENCVMAVEKTKKLRKSCVRIGESSVSVPAEDIGKYGIHVMVMEINNKKYAYILVDGNNMTKKIKNGIYKSMKDIVDDTVILTTDNHAVNLTMDGFNPVGTYSNLYTLVDNIKSAVTEAMNDFEDVYVGTCSDYVEINVFGNRIAELRNVVNETVTILKYGLPVFIILPVILSVILWL